MDNRVILLLSALALCICAHGCTYQAWYSGLQERQRQECLKLANSADTQKCMDTVNSSTYDQYKAQREEADKASK
jgi:hypothetical protein